MDHNTCRENLSAYLDGELPAREKALLEAHLADCPDCRAALGQLGSVSALFKKHAMEPVPLSLKGGVLGGQKAARPWLKPVLALSAAAAAVLVVLNLNKAPEATYSPELFGARGAGVYEPLPAAGEAGQALPEEELAAPAAPPVGLFSGSDKKSESLSAAASARGSFSQAKFSASNSLGGLRGGAAGAKMKIASPQAAAEFRGPVSLRVYTPSTLYEADAGTAKALVFLKKNGIELTLAAPGRLVFIKNDGTRSALTGADCSYGFIFFDGVQDPLVVVTDFGSIPARYNKYFGTSFRQVP